MNMVEAIVPTNEEEATQHKEEEEDEVLKLCALHFCCINRMFKEHRRSALDRRLPVG